LQMFLGMKLSYSPYCDFQVCTVLQLMIVHWIDVHRCYDPTVESNMLCPPVSLCLLDIGNCRWRCGYSPGWYILDSYPSRNMRRCHEWTHTLLSHCSFPSTPAEHTNHPITFE
jgi:hypothetical protein